MGLLVLVLVLGGCGPDRDEARPPEGGPDFVTTDGTDVLDTGGETGDPMVAETCAWVGSYDLKHVECGHTRVGMWDDYYSSARITLDHGGEGCEATVVLTSDGCEQTETWALPSATGVHEAASYGVETCNPGACAHEGSGIECVTGTGAGAHRVMVEQDLEGLRLTSETLFQALMSCGLSMAIEIQM